LPPAPRLVVAGNHDIPLWNLPLRLLDPYRGFRRTFGADLEPMCELGVARVVAFNSSRWWRGQHGRVSRGQVERVAAELRACDRERWRIVVAHHPLATADAGNRRTSLAGAALAMRTWAAAGADLVLGGHVHRAALVPLHERHALPRMMWSLVAGTALSNRLRGAQPNSVNLVHVDAGMPPTARVERWDYDPGIDAFACRSATMLAADRDTR
jgi:3',5'-cyclic AMP phosphodiesterase CpdA